MSTSASSQNQNSFHSDEFSGQQDGTQSGSQTATQNGTSSTRADVPAQNQAYYDQAGANLGPDGLSAIQRQALGLAPQPGIGSTAVQTSINDMNALKPGYLDLASRGYTPYAASSAATPASVDPQSGAAFMSAYHSPYENAVVGTTLGDFDRNTANTLNAMRASRSAGSAFGDRSQIADEQFLNDQTLKRAQTEAALRQQGFESGANLGQQDAARSLAAAQSNQSTAANLNMFNAGQTNQVAQNNAANSLANANLNLGALNAEGSNAVNTSQLAQQGVRLNSDLANGLFNLGSAGQGQLINLFSAGNPLIGQTTKTSGSSNSSFDNKSSNTTSGKSSGYSSGSGSSKGGSIGGGLQFPI
jgi:hypothetical protein